MTHLPAQETKLATGLDHVGNIVLHMLAILALCIALARSDWLPGTATLYGGADGSGTMGTSPSSTPFPLESHCVNHCTVNRQCIIMHNARHNLMEYIMLEQVHISICMHGHGMVFDGINRGWYVCSGACGYEHHAVAGCRIEMSTRGGE
jgi:hypothetical protein